MVARQSCCGYPSEYVSEMSIPHGQPNDEVKGVRERRLRSDAIRAALRCGADAPGLPSPLGWGNCAALRGAVAIRSGRVAPDGPMANSGGRLRGAMASSGGEIPRWLAKNARASVPSSVSAGGTTAETETRKRQQQRRPPFRRLEGWGTRKCKCECKYDGDSKSDGKFHCV
jgi:hypothetical protein